MDRVVIAPDRCTEQTESLNSAQREPTNQYVIQIIISLNSVSSNLNLSKKLYCIRWFNHKPEEDIW